MPLIRPIFIAIMASLTTVLVSCSKTAPPTAAEKSQRPMPAGQPAVGNEPLVLSAAASTKEVMETLSEQIKATSGTEVKINLGPSSGLATQILKGAPADLFLSANQEWADAIKSAGLADSMCRLLTNKLVMIVPKGNPGAVHEPKDLLSARVKKVSLAGEQVPAGKYAEQSLKKLGLLQQLVDGAKIVRGQDVRSALTYVERGEAEAGIVYATDVGVAPQVESVFTFDPAQHNEIVYVLVLVKRGAQNPAARQFYEFLQSSTADQTYVKFGFLRLH
jgi:molybdate transport system substrate-binding protein